MASNDGHARANPILLRTERLILRLADPYDEKDRKALLRWYNDGNSRMGGNARVAINTDADVIRKHELHGPKPQLCTLNSPPYGCCFLSLLPRIEGQQCENDDIQYPEGTLIGGTTMSFRKEMPFPDIGYAVFAPWEGKGYASEAGRTALTWWREVIGVKEIFAGALNNNKASLKCAARIGFVRGGSFLVKFGKEPDVKSMEATAMILPDMIWNETDENGDRTAIWPTIGTESDEQKNDPLKPSARKGTSDLG